MDRREMILAAKRAVAALPAGRRAELEARFRRAQELAMLHAVYVRPS